MWKLLLALTVNGETQVSQIDSFDNVAACYAEMTARPKYFNWRNGVKIALTYECVRERAK